MSGDWAGLTVARQTKQRWKSGDGSDLDQGVEIGLLGVIILWLRNCREDESEETKQDFQIQFITIIAKI